MSDIDNEAAPVALVTGAAQRIGACIARTLHNAGFRVLLHYRHSADAATALLAELNNMRADTAHAIAADLCHFAQIEQLASKAQTHWGRLDVLINNASAFYPTPIGHSSEAQWDELVGSNMKAPFFLAQALATTLRGSGGSIINITDIHADRPLPQHTIYCMAKAGNAMLTKSLALELAPHVRVNGIAPGAILWPEHGGACDNSAQQQLLWKIPLLRKGEAQDVADTALFLLRSRYITGQIIAVDGGRSINN